MTLSFSLLVYGILFYVVASYLLVNIPLSRQLCAYCKTPGREALVAVVAGILWPVLLAAYVAGVLYFGVTMIRGYRQWT